MIKIGKEKEVKKIIIVLENWEFKISLKFLIFYFLFFYFKLYCGLVLFGMNFVLINFVLISSFYILVFISEILKFLDWLFILRWEILFLLLVIDSINCLFIIILILFLLIKDLIINE